MKYGKHALGVVGALVLCVGANQAKAVTLASLISSNGTISSGGLIYSGFSETGNLSANNITVTLATDGIHFSANWNTLTPGHDTAAIGYTVSVDPTKGGTLTSSGLAIAGTVNIHNATTTVNETLTDVTTNNAYSMKVFTDGAGGLSDSLKDNTTFNPAVTSLRIIKSIDVAAGFGAFASLNFVENTFVNGGGTGAPPPVIPEPMSLTLLPLALAALGLRKKLARS